MAKSKKIKALRSEVKSLRRQLDGLVEFIGYNEKPYSTVIRANKVTVNQNG